jgi:hypothetical protein
VRSLPDPFVAEEMSDPIGCLVKLLKGERLLVDDQGRVAGNYVNSVFDQIRDVQRHRRNLSSASIMC